MKILIDTSAWIEFYHPRGDKKVKQELREILEAGRHEVATLAPIIAELLTGPRTAEEFETLWRDLKGLICLPLLREEGGVAGRLARELARRRKRVPLVDLLIAGAAQIHGYQIWHFGDEHFELLASFGGPPHRDLKQI